MAVKDIDHHWLGLEPDPANWFGFVYLIVNNKEGLFYIGKKQYWYRRGHKRKGKVRRVMTNIDSGWRNYTSSSKWLNQDVKRLGRGAFSYYIIAHYKNKGDLRYGEAVEQFLRNVLIDDQCYNKQIEGMAFKPSMDDAQYHETLSLYQGGWL